MLCSSAPALAWPLCRQRLISENLVQVLTPTQSAVMHVLRNKGDFDPKDCATFALELEPLSFCNAVATICDAKSQSCT